LNPIYNRACRYPRGSLAFTLWHDLLEVSYQEFGHVATAAQCDDVPPWRYWHDWRGYRYVEQSAIDWANRRMGELRDHDPKPAQPADLGSYLGARLCESLRYLNRCADGTARGSAVKQWRCRQTGAQLASGNVLKALKLDPWRYPNAYAVLRVVSQEIGTVWVDQAGRQHRLYV
jgi:hypothetical protein